MMLYKVPRNTKIRLLEDAPGPPYHRSFSKGEVINFHHIDGFYSYCTDDTGTKVHIPALTEVEIVLDKE